MMSGILQFFKPIGEKHNVPDPRGPLSMRVPSSAIAAANKEVMEMRANTEKKRKSKRGHYYTYTSEQRAEIGQYASKNGVQAAKRKYSRKLGITINESTVRKFRNLYVKTLKKRTGEQYNTCYSIASQKTR